MTLDDAYLTYPNRRRGLDHSWFEFRSARAWPNPTWPAGKPVALWIIVPVESFPLAVSRAPFSPTGTLEPPAGNLWAYSNRDYGNRVGIYRLFQALDELGLKATAAVNAAVVANYGHLVDECEGRGWEIAGHGLTADAPLHGGMTIEEERQTIDDSLRIVRQAAKGPIRGWISPAHSQSFHTLELLRDRGVSWVADWVNDEVPYPLAGTLDPMMMIPTSHELADRRLLVEQDRTVDEFVRAVLDAFAQRLSEAGSGGRILPLTLTPWVVGYPHRIAAIRRLLGALVGSGQVWCANGSEIVDACRAPAAP